MFYEQLNIVYSRFLFRVIFAKFPADIAQRKVLLLYPIMRTGNKVSRAVQVLIEHKAS